MSDFEWFGEVFDFSMFNMFTCFYHILLISEVNSCPILMFQYSFRSLWPALQEYELKLPLGTSKVAEMAIFGHILPFLGALEAP